MMPQENERNKCKDCSFLNRHKSSNFRGFGSCTCPDYKDTWGNYTVRLREINCKSCEHFDPIINTVLTTKPTNYKSLLSECSSGIILPRQEVYHRRKQQKVACRISGLTESELRETDYKIPDVSEERNKKIDEIVKNIPDCLKDKNNETDI